jgi:hypothetical protein
MKMGSANDNKPKRYVALARVSSREQEREGFSLNLEVSLSRGDRI